MGTGLETLPELKTALPNQGQPIFSRTLLFQELQRALQTGEQGQAGGGHLKTTGIGMYPTASLGFLAQAAPADQGGAPFGQQSLGDGHHSESLRSTTPFMARTGVDIGRISRTLHGQAAKGLGRIHQQPGPGLTRLQQRRHLRNRHHLAGVPEQMGEDNQSGVGG